MVVETNSEGAAGPARRQRFEPDERRRQILHSAIRVFEQHPYAAVSTIDLARAAGVTRGLMHHYFGTKRELYLEVIRTLVTVPEMDGFGTAAGTREERVDSFLAEFLDFVERHGPLWVAAISAEGLGSDPDVLEVLDTADDAAATRLIEVMGLEEVAAAAPDVHSMVRAYGGMVKAATREWIARGALSRARVHVLLRSALLGIIDDAMGVHG